MRKEHFKKISKYFFYSNKSVEIHWIHYPYPTIHWIYYPYPTLHWIHCPYPTLHWIYYPYPTPHLIHFFNFKVKLEKFSTYLMDIFADFFLRTVYLIKKGCPSGRI